MTKFGGIVMMVFIRLCSDVNRFIRVNDLEILSRCVIATTNSQPLCYLKVNVGVYIH